MRLRLDLGYDGTAFSGWAAQPGLRTVQGVLEAALGRVLRLPRATVVVAGRTDAGVHARGQVCHVDLPHGALAAARTTAASLPVRLRGVLPDDVVVTGAELAPAGFDARFSALRRRYAYRACDDPAGVPPLRRHDVVAVRGPLDVAAMAAAGAGLLGLHDFAAFCRRREGAGTVRGLQRLDVAREPAAGGGTGEGLVVVRAVADAFCHSMVRSLVGALLAVGQGRRPPDWPASVLAARVRDGAVQVAPARGLVLEGVDYPPPGLLAERAAAARARRGPPGGGPGDGAAGPWHARAMTESTSATPGSTPDAADLDAPTPVAAEPHDHDGVMEVGDVHDERVNDAMLDQSWSPPEREHHVGRFGLTESEARLGEGLDERLAQEEPELPAGSGGSLGAGSPEAAADQDDDGELLDDEVGTVRAGRLVDPDQGGGPDTEKSMVGDDVGIDGGAASAEEAAVHVVAEPDGDDPAADVLDPLPR